MIDAAKLSLTKSKNKVQVVLYSLLSARDAAEGFKLSEEDLKQLNTAIESLQKSSAVLEKLTK